MKSAHSELITAKQKVTALAVFLLEPVHIGYVCGFSSKFCRGQGENPPAYWRMSRIFNAVIGKICRKDVHIILCGQVLSYSSDRDSSGGKILCEENGVPAVPGIAANSDKYLREVDCTELLTKENAVPESVEIDDSNFSSEVAVPDEEVKGNAFIAMVAEMMKRNLGAQGIIVPTFEHAKKQIQAGFTAK